MQVTSGAVAGAALNTNQISRFQLLPDGHVDFGQMPKIHIVGSASDTNHNTLAKTFLRKRCTLPSSTNNRKLEKGHNEKTNVGTSKSTVPKKLLKAPKLPYYLKTNAPYFSAALSKEESFYILPDKVFYVHNGKLSTYDADEVEYDAQLVHPVIDKTVMKIPKDTKVVDTTWLKVNADGSRDKRYKSNRQCYICECGQLRVYSPSGLNLYLMFSNPESIDDFDSVIAK